MKANINARRLRPGRFAMAFLVTLLSVSAQAAQAGNEPTAESAGQTAGKKQGVLSIVVVQNGQDFFFEGPVNENGFPAKGTPFVTTGYIYPAGVLQWNGSDSGILPNGEPAFPALVMGTWTCRGWHLQDGDATTGPVVATTQTFDFAFLGPNGQHMLTTEGIELADFNLPFTRPVTGGSGVFSGARGESEQTYVDTNASGGYNMTFNVKWKGSVIKH